MGSTAAATCRTSVPGETDIAVAGSVLQEPWERSTDSCRKSTAIAITIMVTLSGQAHAACVRVDRILVDLADCLPAIWHNPSGLTMLSEPGWYSIQNVCHRDGRVVAEVDLKSVMDDTLHFADDVERSREVWARIRGVYCSSDLSDPCSS